MEKKKWSIVPSFKEFCKQQKGKEKKKINENNEVGINVPFWDDAIDFTLNELHNIAGDPIDWDRLAEFVKAKFIVLDRESSYDDGMVLAHIKDILFYNYSTNIDLTFDQTTLGAQTLVISALAEEIIKRVRVEANLDIEPEPENTKPVATVSLDNGWGYDDDCFESKRKVKEYEQFSELLEEAVYKLRCDNYNDCLDYCLNAITAETGSLRYDDVIKVAKTSTNLNDETKIVTKYISDKAMEAVSKSGNLKISNVYNSSTDACLVLHQAMEVFRDQIAEDIMDKIAKETGVTNEKAK